MTLAQPLVQIFLDPPLKLKLSVFILHVVDLELPSSQHGLRHSVAKMQCNKLQYLAAVIVRQVSSAVPPSRFAHNWTADGSSACNNSIRGMKLRADEPSALRPH